MAMCGINYQYINACFYQRSASIDAIGSDSDRGRHTQPTLAVLGRMGILPGFFNILDGN
jgi:hypothetical protein